MCSYWKVETTSRHTWKTFLLLHQCAPSRVFPIKTGATINTSLGQLMVSPHGGDDMLAQVWNWSKYLSTYFTYEISFVNHLYLLNGELHNVPIYIPHSKSSTTTSKSSFILFANCIRNFCINALLQWSKFACWASVNFRVAHLDECESTRALWLCCPWIHSSILVDDQTSWSPSQSSSL